MPIFLSILLSLTVRAWAQDHFDVVISGAGPAGLAAGIAARLAGAERVLVVERRPLDAWASRDRSVFLSDATMETLGRYEVEVPITPIASWHVVRGGRQRKLPNAGHWKNEIFARIFHRRFEGIVSIGAFERRLLERYRALGGQIVFDRAAEITEPGDMVRSAEGRVDGRAFTADLVVVAEGGRSQSRARLGIDTVSPDVGTNPTYASIDFHLPQNDHPGECYFFIAESGGLDGYGCRADGYGTFGLINPERFDDDERASKLNEMARQIGVEPTRSPRGYEGRLSLARGVRRGRVLLIGDAARLTDPSSSSGLNGALVDAGYVEEFFRGREDVSLDERLSRLGRGVTANTADVLRKALYFQDLFAWGSTSLRRVWGNAPLGGLTRPNTPPSRTVHDAFNRFGTLLPDGIQGWAVDRIMRLARGPGDIAPDRYPDIPKQMDEECTSLFTEKDLR